MNNVYIHINCGLFKGIKLRDMFLLDTLFYVLKVAYV